MPFDTFSTSIPPVDAELVDKIVSKLKSQGIFDQFRKDCLADVDTKPAYQNLQQRVNGTVASFLATQQWQPDLNKTQLRETLRRHVQQGFLEVGVDRIVDQVVNPKIVPLFMPKVEDVVCDCLGIEKPKLPLSATFSTQFLTSFPPPLPRPSTPPKLSDLLPKDLDPVSPESDNLCINGGDTPLKDERNNNDSSIKFDDDSQLSGISDLSSHIGDNSYRENPLHPADSNTVKSISSPKPENETLQFDNFTNLSEKIKQAEKTHGQVSGPNPEELVDDMNISEELTGSSPKEIKGETMSEVVKFEFSSNFQNTFEENTFEDSKTFVTNKSVKDDTFSQTCSEDSMSSNLVIKEKVENNYNLLKQLLHDSESSNMVIDTQDNDSFQRDMFKAVDAFEGINDQVEDNIIDKSQEKVSDSKEGKKEDDKIKDKKSNSSASTKYSKSSDKHKQDRHSDSKHRSNHHDKREDKPRDHSNEKEKSSKEDKGDKPSKDEKYRSSQKDDKHKSHKHDRESSHRSEKDSANKDDKKDKYKKEEKDKGNVKEKEKVPSKDDQSGSKSHKDDKSKLKDEKHSSSKDRYREKERSEKSNKGSESGSRKDYKNDSKDHPDKERKGNLNNKEKEQSTKNKQDNDKEKEQSSRNKHEHDKDRRDRNDKDKTDRERKTSEKDKERSRYDKDKADKSGKHEKEKVSDEKLKDSKRKDPKSHDKTYHSSSSSKKSENKSDDPERKQKTDETSKNKHEDEKKDRKRKGDSCKSDVKVKDPRRSSDRDNSGSKGIGGNRANSDNRTGTSHSSKNSGTEKKSRGSSSSGTNANQDHNEKESNEVDSEPPDQVDNGPSEVDLILSRLNSSIEEIENSEMKKESVIEEVPVKKPKIAKNFTEIRKIMQARKNIDRKIRGDLKSCKDLNEMNLNSTEEPETCDTIESQITEENKENFKTSEFEKTKLSKNFNNKNKCFVGFNDAEIEKSINNYLEYENNVYIFERTIYTQSIIDNYKQSNRDLNEDLVDNNLNKLNPKVLAIPEEIEQDNKLKDTNGVGNNMFMPKTKCLEIDKNIEISPPSVMVSDENTLERLRDSGRAKVEGAAVAEEPLAGDNMESGSPNNRKRPAPEEEECSKEDTMIERCTPETPAQENELKQPNPDLQESSAKGKSPVSPESVSDEDKGLSISLTEDMLNNLMKESMCIEMAENQMEYSDDSDCEGRTETKEIVVNQNITPLNHNESLNESTQEKLEIRNTHINEPVGETTNASNNDEECRMNNISNSISPKSGNDEIEKDGSNKHPRRLSRSTQRYSSTDLYKPRPVIPQNTKRVRAPKSEVSEESDSKQLRPKRDQSEPTAKRKKSR